MRKTNPIRGPGTQDCGLKEVSGGDAQPIRLSLRAGSTKSRSAQNEPNFTPAQPADGGHCAKRSQTWRDWGIWAKAIVVWRVARAGNETCKTNPIGGPGAQDCGLKEKAAGDARPPFRSGGRLYDEAKCAKRTQFEPRAREWARGGGPRGSAGRRLCKTNPISGQASV